LLLNNILAATAAQIPLFFIGRVHGPRALGLYTVGAQIAFLPATELIAPINRAVLPGYARMATNPETLREGFVDIISVILLVALPASFGLAAIAEPLVRVVLGAKWLDAIPVIETLAFCGAIGAMHSNNYSAYIALGQQRVAALIMGAHLIVMVPSMIVLGGKFGILGVAYAELIAMTVSLALSYPVLFKTLKISVRSYGVKIWRPLLAATAMGFAVHTLVREATVGDTALAPGWQLAVLIPAGVAIYLVSLAILWLAAGKPSGAETLLLARLTEATSRFKRLWQA
jgi:lipopolysaccharide exporter